MTDPADRARILSLVLDAVDPRVDGDVRAEAFVKAGELDEGMAYTYTRGMVHGLLRYVLDRDGEAVVRSLVGMLTETSTVLFDHEQE